MKVRWLSGLLVFCCIAGLNIVTVYRTESNTQTRRQAFESVPIHGPDTSLDSPWDFACPKRLLLINVLAHHLDSPSQQLSKLAPKRTRTPTLDFAMSHAPSSSFTHLSSTCGSRWWANAIFPKRLTRVFCLRSRISERSLRGICLLTSTSPQKRCVPLRNLAILG